MKRMNLVHGALVVVLTFMGTFSLSAQNWLPSVQAVAVIANELAVLAEAPTPVPSAGITTKQQMSEQNAKIGCTDCLLTNVKYQFLQLALVKIKEGTATGTAVQEVYQLMLGKSNNNPTMISTIQQAYEFMLDKLS